MNWRPETMALHAGQEPDPTTRSRAVPIYQTSSFVFRDTQEAAELFGLEPQVWAPRLNLDQEGLRPEEFSPQDAGNIYSRIMNPTTDVLEKRMMHLEGGIGALAASSGAAAVTYAVLNICRSGEHIVSSNSLYGGTYNLFLHTLPQYGINTTFVNCSRPHEFAQNIQDNTRCLFVETIGNPGLDFPDLQALADIADQAGIPLIVDNTVPTPYLCRPMDFGAHITVHSLTKFCGGHGNSIGGIIVDSGQFPWDQSGKFPMLSSPDPSYHNLVWTEAVGPSAYIIRARTVLMRDTGACPSPLNSFLILQGLETLHLRMQRHCENALSAAQYLQSHPRVTWVLYPGLENHPSHAEAKKYLQHGFGALISFGVSGGLQAARDFINNLQLFSHLANIGDAKSLAIHPASTTHVQLSPEEQEQSGVRPDMIRLSVGLEHIDDILQDLQQALDNL